MRRAALLAALLLAACGGSGGDGGGGDPPPPVPPAPPPTGVYAVPAAVALSAAEVERVLAQGAAEARARNRPAVLAVVDRVGNVLGVFAMAGARADARVRPGPGGNFDLQGATVPAAAAAIAKAVTGAYLSSGGNAFSTRTASQIVQAQFPPSTATQGLEAGPLFGVQFSQLPCSDLAARAGGPAPLIGPKRSPLGLAADPGGLPLYKGGVLVGGVGVMADGDYGFDPEVRDLDRDDEEIAALAATTGFEPPAAIRAERISVDGTTLRYADATAADFASNPANAGALGGGALIAVNGYAAAAIVAGAAYGTEPSGVRAATAAEFDDPDAFVLSDGNGMGRFPVRAATDAAEVASPLTAAEARALLRSAFAVMKRARAQIRQPLDSRAQVSIAVVDTRGVALGLVRAPDAPLFGTDVALQKARSAALFSGGLAAAELDATGDPAVRDFVRRTPDFVGQPAFLTGGFAVTTRTLGNLARPFFPDGETGRGPGPLARPIAEFSPFAVGLQSALIAGDVARHLGFVGGTGPDLAPRCTALPSTRLANGLQIFPGSVPVYRGDMLVGALGVSGDGIDQDDLVAFLGADGAGLGLGNAPAGRRADRIVVGLPNSPGVRLRYVSCPFAPFLDTAQQNVCDGR